MSCTVCEVKKEVIPVEEAPTRERFLDASGGLTITASGQYTSDEICNLFQDLISCAQTSGNPFTLFFEMREVREVAS